MEKKIINNEIEGLFDGIGKEVETSALLDKEFIEKSGYDKVFGNKLLSIDSKQYLDPTVCFGIFDKIMHKKSKIEKDCIFRSQNTCFRNEEDPKSYHQKDFKMMELLAFGEEDFVRDVLDTSIKKVLDFLSKTYKLNCSLERANDGFFLDGRRKSILSQLQSSAEGKKELRVLIHNQSVPVASINYHARKYINNFSLDTPKKFVSGCFGVGLSRINNMVSDQNGYK